jgi:hypothetical protein
LYTTFVGFFFGSSSVQADVQTPSITTLVVLEEAIILHSARTNSIMNGTTMTILAFHQLPNSRSRVEPLTSYSTVGEPFVLSEVNLGKRPN